MMMHMSKNMFVDQMKGDYSYDCLLEMYDYLECIGNAFDRGEISASYSEYASLEAFCVDHGDDYQSLDEVAIVFSFDGGFVVFS